MYRRLIERDEPSLISQIWPWLTAAIVALAAGIILSRYLDYPWRYRIVAIGLIIAAGSAGYGILRTGPTGIRSHWLIEDAYSALWAWLWAGFFLVVLFISLILLKHLFASHPQAEGEIRLLFVGLFLVGLFAAIGIWDWLRG